MSNQIERAKYYLSQKEIEIIARQIRKKCEKKKYDAYKNYLIKFFRDEYGKDVSEEVKSGTKTLKRLREFDFSHHISQKNYTDKEIAYGINRRDEKKQRLMRSRKSSIKNKLEFDAMKLKFKIDDIKRSRDKLYHNVFLPLELRDQIDERVEKEIKPLSKLLAKAEQKVSLSDKMYSLKFLGKIKKKADDIPENNQTICVVCGERTGTDYRAYCNITCMEMRRTN
jgi:hypothetical protein